MTDREVKSLIALLEDDDDEIQRHVHEKLLSLGHDIIPFLETEWGVVKDLQHQQRIENIIHKIQFTQLIEEFRQWHRAEEHDLMKGVYLVAKYRYPALEITEIRAELERLRAEVWMEINHKLTPFEKVRLINFVLYQVNRFKGNTENYHDPQNSFINQVLETRKGNPIMLAVVYLLVARQLQIPVYGVNLPQHFVLAYLDNPAEKTPLPPTDNKILFYVNAFNNGTIFNKANLEQFLRQINLEPKMEFFEPCTNLDIVKRILRNLSSAYNKQGKLYKQNEVQTLLYTLGEPPIDHFEDVTGRGSD